MIDTCTAAQNASNLLSKSIHSQNDSFYVPPPLTRNFEAVLNSWKPKSSNKKLKSSNEYVPKDPLLEIKIPDLLKDENQMNQDAKPQKDPFFVSTSELKDYEAKTRAKIRGNVENICDIAKSKSVEKKVKILEEVIDISNDPLEQTQFKKPMLGIVVKNRNKQSTSLSKNSNDLSKNNKQSTSLSKNSNDLFKNDDALRETNVNVIPRSDLKIEIRSVLGAGTFAIVRKGTWDNKTVAVKSLDYMNKPNDNKLIFREVLIL